MRARAGQLTGIVNGLDYDEWNPQTDEHIYKNYSVDNFRKEKVKNKLELQKELGLAQDKKAMMIGIVSRLTDQKGFDLIDCITDELCQDSVPEMRDTRTCSVISHGNTEIKWQPASIIPMRCRIRSMQPAMHS